MTKRHRLEEDGFYLEPKEHWEMWETKMCISSHSHPQKYTTRNGEIKSCVCTSTTSNIHVPKDIIRHLNLKHNDKVMFAIKKIIEEKNNDS